MPGQPNDLELAADAYRKSLQARFFPAEGMTSYDARVIEHNSKKQVLQAGPSSHARQGDQSSGPNIMGLQPAGAAFDPDKRQSSEERAAGFSAGQEQRQLESGSAAESPSVPARVSAPALSRQQIVDEVRRERLNELVANWGLGFLVAEFEKPTPARQLNTHLGDLLVLLQELEGLMNFFESRDLTKIDHEYSALLKPFQDSRVHAARWASFRLYEFLRQETAVLDLQNRTHVATHMANALSRKLFGDPARLESVVGASYIEDKHRVAHGDPLSPGDQIEPLTFVVLDSSGKVAEKAVVRKLVRSDGLGGGSA